jgi:inner membrane protein
MLEGKGQKLKSFSQGYTAKILILFVLVIVMLVPLTMIQSIVRERNRTASSAENEVLEAWGGNLVVAGPVLGLPCFRTEEIVTENSNGIKSTEIKRTAYTLAAAPSSLTVKTNLRTQIKKRGIFSVPIYTGTVELSGAFELSRALQSVQNQTGRQLNTAMPARLYISLESQKGIKDINGSVGGADLFFEPGSALPLAPRRTDKDTVAASANSSGVNARVDWTNNMQDGGSVPFSIVLEIQGGAAARFLPIAQDTTVQVAADWPSPSFQGAFLPVSSQITDKDFSAEWNISYLSRDIPLLWRTETADLKTS